MKDRIRNILFEATAFKDRSNINDAFWKWFGNSVAVNHDRDGEPQIFYHGTRNSNFKHFKIRKPNEKGLYYRFMETGIWVTPQPVIASRFTRTRKLNNPVEMESMKDVLNNVVNESDKFFPKDVYFASERYNMDENSIKAIMDVINLEKEKDVCFFIVRYDQKGNHSVSFVDEDKNTIDEIVFESDKTEFEEVALEKIKMLCERNREMFE